jgi:two-component system chemotaxis response regulator CheY
MPAYPVKKVLIIEEDPNYRMLLQHILKGLNCWIIGVESGGDEAIDLFERKKPDVVLLNITTPLELGLAVLKELINKDPNVKVIMITNVTEEDTVKRCIEAGAAGYILKGSADAEIHHRLANLINH